MKQKISVIVPCYNEEAAIPYFYEEIKRISKEMEEMDFEYLFINVKYFSESQSRYVLSANNSNA